MWLVIDVTIQNRIVDAAGRFQFDDQPFHGQIAPEFPAKAF
jgi:hypothetical protein